MSEQSFPGHRRRRGDFLERLIGGLAGALQHARDTDDHARRKGLLQQLDPRVKLAGVFGLITVAVFVKSLAALLGLLAVAIALALASGVAILTLTRQVWLGVLLFTGPIALPAVFLVPGDVVLHLPVLAWPVTAQGLRSTGFLLGRSETAATLALLLIVTTPWPHVLKALRLLGVPVTLVAILGITHRYVFVLLQAATQMLEARRSRMVGRLPPRERRRLATATAGALFGKALDISTEVHMAMIARGYRGEPRILDDFRTRPVDWAAAAGFVAVGGLALWLSA